MPDPNLERLDRFELALTKLRDIVGVLPDDKQAERAIRTEEATAKILQVCLAATAVLLLGILAGAITAVQARQAAKDNRAGIQCILRQQAEDRVTNQDIHDRLAAEHGIAGTPRTLLPGRPTADELRKFCDRFYSQTEAER